MELQLGADDGVVIREPQARARFGSVEVLEAALSDDAKCLRLQMHSGALNKHEVGMLILFLKALQERMKSQDQ
jgi:hypothetical protein